MRTREIANDTKTSELDNQWAVVMHFLPQGWQDAAWTYGAISRLRAIQSAEELLRLSLGGPVSPNLGGSMTSGIPWNSMSIRRRQPRDVRGFRAY